MELLLLLVFGAVGTVLFFAARTDSPPSNAQPAAAEPEPVGDVFLDVLERPVAGSDLEYVEFFDLPRDLTVGEAERVIEGDWKKRSTQEKREWHAYSAILEGFADPETLAALHLKAVPRPTLILALEQLFSTGRTYTYINSHPGELAEAILALDPGLSTQPKEET